MVLVTAGMALPFVTNTSLSQQGPLLLRRGWLVITDVAASGVLPTELRGPQILN